MVDWKELGKDSLKVGGTALTAYIAGELLKDSTPSYISEAIDVAKDLSVALLARKGLQDINHDHLNGSNITDKVIDAGIFGFLGVEMLDNMAESSTVRDFGRFLGIDCGDTLKSLDNTISKYGNKIRTAFGLGYLMKDKLAEAYEHLRDY